MEAPPWTVATLSICFTWNTKTAQYYQSIQGDLAAFCQSVISFLFTELFNQIVASFKYISIFQTQISSSSLNTSTIQDWWILSNLGVGLPQLWTSEDTCRVIFLFFPSCELQGLNSRCQVSYLYPVSYLVNLKRHRFSSAGPIVVQNESTKCMVTIFCFSILGIKPRHLSVLDKCSTMELHPQPSFATTIFFKISRARYDSTYL